jgi:RNA polymerase sigma factor (sigma-70 family)
MESSSFTELWKAYQAGDRDAQGRLLTAFIPRIRGLTRKYLRAKCQQEEDVTQSILKSFIAHHVEAIHAIEQPDELWELFAAITLRHCGKHNKRGFRESQRGKVLRLGAAQHEGTDDSLHGYEPADAAVPPDVQAAIEDLFAQCHQELTERQQHVLDMHLASMERKEIAEALQIAIVTVDRELKKIKTVLAELVGAEAD